MKRTCRPPDAALRIAYLARMLCCRMTAHSRQQQTFEYSCRTHFLPAIALRCCRLRAWHPSRWAHIRMALAVAEPPASHLPTRSRRRTMLHAPCHTMLTSSALASADQPTRVTLFDTHYVVARRSRGGPVALLDRCALAQHALVL